MPIRVRLNVMLAERNVKSKDLAEHIGITEANLSLLKQGKVKGVRFEYAGADLRISELPAGRFAAL